MDLQRIFGRATLGLAVAVGGCHNSEPPPPRQVEAAAYASTDDGRLEVREDLATLLRFAPVKIESVAAWLEGFGSLDFAPGASYAISVPFDGIVESVLVQRGDDVVPGQLLGKLRSRELAKLRADLPRLDATLVAERDSLKRLVSLQKQEAASEREVIEATARVKSLEAETEGIRIGLTAAKAELEGGDVYLIKAERKGQVLERNIHPGEHLDSSTPQSEFLIADPSRLIVIAQFPERDSPLLKNGQSASIRVSALRDEELTGSVSAVVRSIDPDNRTTTVVCTLSQADERLQAKMSLRVKVEVHGAPQLVVPQAAILLRRESRVVLVRRGERQLERRTVQVGGRIGDQVQVLSGVSEGEEVVVENAVLLDGELDQVLSAN